MYRYIPFEEIEKDKWNGAVHYAVNGNVFGYYWYLKATLSEWDAIVENDYESVIPVFKDNIKPYQLELLPELGPYSVNPISEQRALEMLEMVEKHSKSNTSPLSFMVSKTYLSTFNYKTKQKAVFQGGKQYWDVAESFSDEYKQLQDDGFFDSVKIKSEVKPEELVDLVKNSNLNSSNNEKFKHALLRIIYNAKHRGIGFTSALYDTTNGNLLGASFFVSVNNTIYEIVHVSSKPKVYRHLIHDLLLRGNAEKQLLIETYSNVSDMQEIGFDLEPYHHVQFKNADQNIFQRLFGI